MKKKKILLYGFLALVAIIVAIFLFLGRYTDRVVDPYVRTLLEETKPMGHHIEYKKIRVNLFQGSIILKEVRMFPDSSLTKDRIRMAINVKDIRLTGFSIRQLLFNKTLRIKEFLVENPEVKLTLPDSAGKIVQEAREQKPEKQGSQFLKHISLEKILFSGGSFQLIRHDTLQSLKTSIFLHNPSHLLKIARRSQLGSLTAK
jgi:hypothetical protein